MVCPQAQDLNQAVFSFKTINPSEANVAVHMLSKWRTDPTVYMPKNE